MTTTLILGGVKRHCGPIGILSFEGRVACPSVKNEVKNNGYKPEPSTNAHTLGTVEWRILLFVHYFRMK